MMNSSEEDLCTVKWVEFEHNVREAFGSLRNEKDFTDVTLACEDGQQVEAHRVILASSSPFFENLFKRNRHSHPLIYMRGLNFEDLLAILDFLYTGEANIRQSYIGPFLAIADELGVKGLTSHIKKVAKWRDDIPKDLKGKKGANVKEEGEVSDFQPTKVENVPSPLPLVEMKQFKITPKPERLPEDMNLQSKSLDEKVAKQRELFNQLNEKINLMMEESETMVFNGSQMNRTYQCKICGKRSSASHIRDHIEGNHLQGVLIPCVFCPKVCKSRSGMRKHKHKYHK